ncbi:MAG: monovalent cation/H+ antiporter subunit D family protein [Gammaproteobacteria bacterium]|nr:monovalent cation/H+ antiporter subunit D family protein [Gammaproteobacteria bacterium]
MNATFLLPVLILLSSLVPGMIIFFLPEEWRTARTALNLFGAVLKVLLVGLVALGIASGEAYETRLPLVPGVDLALVIDPLAILLSVLSAVLWLVTTIYAVGYLEGSPDRSRFFGFFSICVTATVGVAMAGNLVTFLLFYELLTLSTYPLVVHRGTEVARRAGRAYLFYTLTGGVLLLAGIAWLYGIAGTLEFAPRGFLSELPADVHPELTAIFVLLIAGVGVKAALVPLHGWLPQAMVAPAPVSALLHAVAVVKAGAFGIVRIVQNVYGVEFSEELGVAGPLAAVASVTIVYGSLRALQQNDLKRRLAFSTVSQVSYIALGVAIAGPIASIGGLVHLVHQGIMKITLFFCAGNFAETLGVHKVDEMRGVGRRMPWTTGAFTVAACGMIGLPPLAGFVSKWYLGLGAAAVGDSWVILILIVSGLLNAGYFLPILYIAWFEAPPEPAEQTPRSGGRLETSWQLLLPPVATAALTLIVGLFAAAPWSPLRWVQLVASLGFAE